jgi:hypothetical protein
MMMMMMMVPLVSGQAANTLAAAATWYQVLTAKQCGFLAGSSAVGPWQPAAAAQQQQLGCQQ